MVIRITIYYCVSDYLISKNLFFKYEYLRIWYYLFMGGFYLTQMGCAISRIWEIPSHGYGEEVEVCF